MVKESDIEISLNCSGCGKRFQNIKCDKIPLHSIRISHETYLEIRTGRNYMVIPLEGADVKEERKNITSEMLCDGCNTSFKTTLTLWKDMRSKIKH